ncbi:unnamed protein product, partial [Phaeothamnion confervicola]
MVDRALTLMQDMRADGVLPNEITYNIVLNACGQQGRWASIEALLAEKEDQALT